MVTPFAVFRRRCFSNAKLLKVTFELLCQSNLLRHGQPPATGGNERETKKKNDPFLISGRIWMRDLKKKTAPRKNMVFLCIDTSCQRWWCYNSGCNEQSKKLCLSQTSTENSWTSRSSFLACDGKCQCHHGILFQTNHTSAWGRPERRATPEQMPKLQFSSHKLASLGHWHSDILA